MIPTHCAKKGFTLTELLMVIVILGILSAVALPRFGPQREKAYVSEAVGILSAIRQLEEAHRLENGVYLAADNAGLAANWGVLGMDNPNPVAPNPGFWTYDIAINNGPPPTFTATATRVNNRWSGAEPYANQTVTLDQAGNYGGSHQNRPQ